MEEKDTTEYASEESRERRQPKTYAEDDTSVLTEEEAAEQMKHNPGPTKRAVGLNDTGIVPNQEAGGSYVPEPEK